MNDDDAQLVRRYQAGDASAFDAFVLRHQDRVYRLARLWLRLPNAANDVVQEVFLRSMGGLTGFRFRADPKTWLYRLTRNVCREFNRKEARYVSFPEFEDVDEDEHNTRTRDEAPAQFVGGDDVQELVSLRRLRAALADLPDRQREVTVLRIFEELSVAETAKALACREGTVKAHLHKAMANLRRRLQVAPPSGHLGLEHD